MSRFSDASFAFNLDFSSKIAYIIALMDDRSNVIFFHWKSYNSHRVVKSPLGAETLALADAIDLAPALIASIAAIIRCELLLHIFADSVSLFDAISRPIVTTEK